MSATLPTNAAPEPALVREDVSVRATTEPDLTARAEVNAERVFESMYPDLLTCYQASVRASPRAHAFMTFDVVIGPDGHVLDLTTTGGALLGERGRRCMENRVREATFEPPHGGGTLHLRVPFSMRSVVPGEEP
jgi:hypothetical protein